MQKESLVNNNSNRNYNLDLLKIIACIAVIGLHTFVKNISIITSACYYLCGYAVPIFIMSSGFLLADKKNCSFRYSINKIVRILRTVILCNALFHLEKLIYDTVVKQSFSITFINDFIFDIVKGFVQSGTMWHFWYFGALIILYIALPLISKIKTERSMLTILVGLCFIAISLQQFSYINGFAVQSQVIQTFRIWTWLLYFILGMYIRKKNQNDNKVSTIALICTTILSVFYQLHIVNNIIIGVDAEYFYDSIVYMVWVFVLFTWTLSLKLSDFLIKHIKFISSLTMGVYIVHPFIIRFLKQLLVVDTTTMSILLFIATTVISFLCTWGISKISCLKPLIQL